jgi:hypothetical protein
VLISAQSAMEEVLMKVTLEQLVAGLLEKIGPD